ncbi:MAG TPA: 1,4-alpha-glucan branching protein domain-containing protein [Acidobacteriaceae bacterium]
MSPKKPFGFLSFTLHAHLPYVVNHGTWPHGIEWLLEAAAETYLPLLRVLRNLHRDGIALNCNLNLSPILLEQLAHPVFRTEFPKYLERKLASAYEDEAVFLSTGEAHYAETARFWHAFFAEALTDFRALNGDIASGFRDCEAKGVIEIITSGATHGYMPLLGSDESLRAQIRTAVATHQRHLGKLPRGIWIPECGYRPSGTWTYPVTPEEGGTFGAPFARIGVEQALSENGLEFFLVDTHLVEESARTSSPYELLGKAAMNIDQTSPETEPRRLYQPYAVSGPYDRARPMSVFPRDPRTGLQVWSAEGGYPGEADYLDFHKKRWPGGHRYWRVTGSNVEMDAKEPYYPQAAAERIQSHASHFVHLVWNALQSAVEGDVPPILSAPFDAELFGHWWFEGPMWLEAVARNLHDYPTGLELATASQYLARYPRAGSIAMPEGSWGAGGDNRVWLNEDTTWTYKRIYAAELACRDICSAGEWKDSETGTRIVKQLCRELLLLESSDWQFLITTGAARDYAETRFNTHSTQFGDLQAIFESFMESGALSETEEARLGEIERRDSIFADIDPSFWSEGARVYPVLDDKPAAGANIQFKAQLKTQPGESTQSS